MVAIWLTLWLLAAALAYYNTKAIFVDSCKVGWDKATKVFAAIYSLLLGPVFLLISIEIRILAAIGKGLAENKKMTWKLK
jgi:hypothetical protein